MFKNLFGLVGYVSFVCLVGLAGYSSAIELPRFYGQEVVVTAARMPQLKAEAPWDVEVIKDLGGSMNLGEALRDVPGIDVKSSGYLGSVATARLRGSTSQQVLVLRDGKRMNSPLLGMIDMGDVLLDDIEKIEIARAPLSSLYGSDAIGGVVNLITKKAGRSAEVSYGAYNSGKVSLHIGGTSLALIRSDGFRKNSDYNAQTIGQKLGWEINNIGSIEAEVNYYNAEKGVPRVPDSVTDPGSASTPSDRQKDANLFTSVSYARAGEKIDSWAKFYYNYMYEQFHAYDFFAARFDDTDYRTQQYIAEAGQVLKINRANDLSYGVEARQDKGVSRYAGDHEIQNLAAYGQLQSGMRPFNLVMGARVDRHSVFGGTVNPRLGISCNPGNDLTLRASIGSAFKAPTLNDLYWNDPVWQMYGSTMLSPERSRSVEIGMEKKVGERLALSVNYFNSNINDLIMWDWDIATNITRAKNVGEAEINGGELKCDYQLTPSLLMFANYTLERTENKKDLIASYVGKEVPYSPQTKYNLGIRALKNVKITLSYVGGRYADSGNTVKLPEYTLVNLWAGNRVGKYRAAISIDNLFNQVYYETIGYHPTTYAQMMYPMPGRVMTISIGGTI